MKHSIVASVVLMVLSSQCYGWGAITNKKLYARDFASLGVIYMNTLENAVAELDEYEVWDHPWYLEHKEVFDYLVEKYGPLIDRGYQAPVYVHYIDTYIGYGLFADADIADEQMIGIYAGVIRYDSARSKHEGVADYAWAYPSQVITDSYTGDCNTRYGFDEQTGEFKIRKSLTLIIDPHEAGNYLRFSNHSNQPNAQMLYVPHDDKWYVIYVALRAIKKGEQILVDYGEEYWAGRYMHPVDL